MPLQLKYTSNSQGSEFGAKDDPSAPISHLCVFLTPCRELIVQGCQLPLHVLSRLSLQLELSLHRLKLLHTQVAWAGSYARLRAIDVALSIRPVERANSEDAVLCRVLSNPDKDPRMIIGRGLFPLQETLTERRNLGLILLLCIFIYKFKK